MAVEGPRTLLALFAAVLGAAATAALSKLASVLFPFPALIVGALADTAPCLVFPAQVPHNDPCPVLHVCAVVSYGELLDQGEYVHIIRQKILFLVLVLVNRRLELHIIAVQELQLFSYLQPRY